MKSINLQTRREFLRTTTLGSAMTWTLPAFIDLTMRSLHAEALQSTTQHVTGRDSTILVVLQLAGGNDGLNTVVPWGNDYYYQARPRLAIAQNDVLKINDELGFHPEMSGLQTLYEDGKLAIIQGAGYPNPNRSHFRSMEIWQTATDADRFEQHGWLGRFFDHECAGMDAAIGIHLTHNAPQAFAARQPKGVATSPRQSRYSTTMRGGFELDATDGASISELGGVGQLNADERPLDFIQRTALDAKVSEAQISKALDAHPGEGQYPAHRLGQELEMIARLIAGGMSTRVYYVSQGGYDTHVNQTSTHSRLLKDMSDAVYAFVNDLKAQGNLDRVAIMTFSEFGRRVRQNASSGTDHGAAAPVFVAGGNVHGGLYAKMPSLAPEDLDRGDLRHATDFRSIYATLLEKHLYASHVPILGRSFPLLDFI